MGQLHRVQRGVDVSAGQSGRRGRLRARRGVCVFRRANGHDVAVVAAVCPMVDPVPELQLRPAQLPDDPVDTDWADGHDRGDRLPDGRARPRHVLHGLHLVLGDAGDRVYVVRHGQLFCKKVDAVVRRDRCAHRLPMLGGPRSHRGRRVAHKQDDKFERVRRRTPADRRSVLLPHCQHGHRFGRELLR